MRRLNDLTAKHTAWDSFFDLLLAGNAPTLKDRPAHARHTRIRQRNEEVAELADAYDAAQAELGSTKRAWRG